MWTLIWFLFTLQVRVSTKPSLRYPPVWWTFSLCRWLAEQLIRSSSRFMVCTSITIRFTFMFYTILWFFLCMYMYFYFWLLTMHCWSKNNFLWLYGFKINSCFFSLTWHLLISYLLINWCPLITLGVFYHYIYCFVFFFIGCFSFITLANPVSLAGLLMIAAWILFASIGVVLARYYKPMWADRKLLGEKVWFQVMYSRGKAGFTWQIHYSQKGDNLQCTF